MRRDNEIEVVKFHDCGGGEMLGRGGGGGGGRGTWTFNIHRV